MGIARASGGDLGAARGSITIDTSQPQAVPGIMAGVSQAAASSMGAIDAAAKRNEASLIAARAAVQAYASDTTRSLASARASVQQFASGATGYLSQAQNSVQAFATGANTTLTGLGQATGPAIQGITAIGTASQGTTQSVNSLTNSAQQLVGAFGLSLGAAGIVQLARMGAALADNAATAERTKERYDTLAQGIGEDANSMLESMRAASKGMISDQDLIASSNKGMLLEVVTNSQDLNRLLAATRVLGQAMGQDVSQSFNDAIIGLGRLSPRILDNLGIANKGEQMFEDYAKSVGRTADSLSTAEKQQVLMNQVLQAAAPLLAAEAGKADDQADKTDKATASWKNYTKQLGQSINTFGGVSALTEMTTGALDKQTSILQTEVTWWNNLTGAITNASKAFWQWSGQPVEQGPTSAKATPSWMTGVSKAASSPLGPDHAQEIRDTKLDWGKGISDLTQKTNDDLQKQNDDYQRQRADSESSYQKSTERAAEDFALRRTRQEQELADSIVHIHTDEARREAHEAADLARSISQAETDGAERVAKDKKDAADRLVELDTNYEKERVKRAKDLSDKLLDAAGNLDAKQVYELQRDAAKQEEEAKSAHDDQRDKLQKQLSERLDDESKSLAKSIAQQQDAYNRQLQDGRDADAQRITDMQTDFDKRKTQEDIDYGIRLTRAQQDHNDQLTEMDRAQGLRITQIQTHAAQERTQLDTEHEAALVKLGVHNQDWIDAETKLNNDALKLLEPLLEKGRSLLLFPNAGSNTLPFPSMVGANAPPPYTGGGGNYSNSHSFSPTVNVTISGSSSLTKSDVESAVHDALIKTFEDLN